MSYLQHSFGPNRGGCKTPKLGSHSHKPICGALTSNPRTPGLGVPPKLHQNQHSLLAREVLPRLGCNLHHLASTLAHMTSVTAAYIVDESENLSSAFASTHLNLKIPNLHRVATSKTRLPLTLHDLHWLSSTRNHPPGSTTTRENPSNHWICNTTI